MSHWQLVVIFQEITLLRTGDKPLGEPMMTKFSGIYIYIYIYASSGFILVKAWLVIDQQSNFVFFMHETHIVTTNIIINRAYLLYRCHRGQVITSNNICGMLLLVPALETCFWLNTPDMMAVYGKYFIVKGNQFNYPALIKLLARLCLSP